MGPEENAIIPSHRSRLDSGSGFTFVSNALEVPVDEGIRKCAHELAKHFEREDAPTHRIPGNGPWATRKMLLDHRLRCVARRTGAILYLPSQSATFGTLLRIAVLRLTSRVPVILLSLQPTSLDRLRSIPRRLRPHAILTPSPKLIDEAERVGLPAYFAPMGVNIHRFRPVTAQKKLSLREQYEVREGPVVLHVGHALSGRNLDWLLDVRPKLGATAVAVFGASRGRDALVISRLRAGGVKVIDGFVSRIEELYQLADCYVFTVEDELSAISAPLSILEAMACNLSVVTTRFGGLPQMLEEAPGFTYVSDGEELMGALQKTLIIPPAAITTREMALHYSWDAVARQISEKVRSVA